MTSQLDYDWVVIDQLGRTNEILNIFPFDVDVGPSILVPDDSLVVADVP